MGERKQATIRAITPDTLKRFMEIRGGAAPFGDQDGVATIGTLARASSDVQSTPCTIRIVAA